MKKIIILSISLFFCSANIINAPAQTAGVTGNQLQWHTSLLEAHELSKASHKPIFAMFTGSDWCGWCRKLENDVFSKPEFIEWANKNVILLKLDFPRHTQLSAELTEQNNGLQQALHVSGYPTVWIMYTTKDDATNRFNLATLGSLGYPQGAEIGREQVKFLENANAILATAKSN